MNLSYTPRSLQCIKAEIILQKYSHLFDGKNPSAGLRFEMELTQFISVGNPLARAIECLEATSANPADVYLYWLAILGGVKDALESCYLPDEVCGQIRGIINSRWKEFFVDGPTNAHLSAFYLNPGEYHNSVTIFIPQYLIGYVRSSIFNKPNPLSFNIILPSKGQSEVPPGIQNPRTFLEVARYVFDILVQEVESGVDPVLIAFRKRKALFSANFKQQFTAYAQGAYPFNVPVGPGQTPLEWWKAFVGTENAGIIAVSHRHTIKHSTYFLWLL